MNVLKTDEHDILSYVQPGTLWGALAYLVIFVVLAMLMSKALRAAVHAAMTRNGNGRSGRPASRSERAG